MTKSKKRKTPKSPKIRQTAESKRRIIAAKKRFELATLRQINNGIMSCEKKRMIRDILGRIARSGSHVLQLRGLSEDDSAEELAFVASRFVAGGPLLKAIDEISRAIPCEAVGGTGRATKLVRRMILLRNHLLLALRRRIDDRICDVANMLGVESDR